MPEISLVVTRRALAYITGGRQNQSQIAIRSPSPDIEPTIAKLTADNRIGLRLGGCVTLVAGDPGAIWRAHNTQDPADFDTVFAVSRQ